jgi:hypothetical protein
MFNHSFSINELASAGRERADRFVLIGFVHDHILKLVKIMKLCFHTSPIEIGTFGAEKMFSLGERNVSP